MIDATGTGATGTGTGTGTGTTGGTGTDRSVIFSPRAERRRHRYCFSRVAISSDEICRGITCS